MPIKPERQYRNAQNLEVTNNENENPDTDYIVEGYATTFEPYNLYEFKGNVYREHFKPEAFDNVDMCDVIMQYDHQGRVFARQSNGTLTLSVDDKGLKIRANLGTTEGSRQLWEEIKSGLVTKMSWGFLPATDPMYDEETKTFIWDSGSIKKIYDVSAVSIPANGDTEIEARKYSDGVIARLTESENDIKQKKARDGVYRKIIIEKLKTIGGNN